MNNIIRGKVNVVSQKIDNIKTQVLSDKKELADALRFNGVTNVSNEETFARYAYLIKRLKSTNTMVFQFTIPDTAVTDYKRTIVLPMQFGVDGNKGVDLNAIAKEIIANDTKDYSIASSSKARQIDKVFESVEFEENPLVSKHDDKDSIEDYIIDDVYGNKIIDGTYVAPFTMNDIENYLDEDQKLDLMMAMENLNIMPLTDVEGFEPDTTVQYYSFTVDWGDGSNEYAFDHTKDYEENKKAIWHTYKKPGTYDVTINGVYKRIYTQGRGQGALTGVNEIVDKDGTYKVINTYNYAMINYLVEVIAWGNTMLTSMANAFEGCAKLTTIPMYDTTNSFNEVTTFASAFAYCTSLASLPFNENTQKGLFSGCEKATTFASCFQNCTGIKGSIPPKLIDGCPKVTTTASMFQSCSGISGKIPVDMIKGLTELTNASSMFNGCTGIDDELTPNLFDTCPKISNVASMYQGCTKLHGNVPQEMFKGVTTLTTANGLFNGCTGLNGEIPNDLFEDCELITTISEIFNGCKGIIGKIKRGAFSNLKKLTSMQRAFRNCSGIEGFESGAFEHLEADGLNCFEAFENCTGIQEIPDNLLDGITGKNVRLDRMFPRCSGIIRIGKGNFGAHERTVRVRDEEGNYSEETVMFDGHKPADARGIFGGCTNIAEIADLSDVETTSKDWKTSVSDWEDIEKIKMWFGAFANTAIAKQENSPIYAELGGYGKRKTENQVGKIVLSDRKTVEIKDFIYDAENPPVGMIYTDIYLDKDRMIPTLPNNTATVDGGNVVADKAENGVHKIYASVLNDVTKPWTNGQANAEDITTITNTSDVNVAYNRYTWDVDGNTTLNKTRYNGEAYTKAINEWRVSKNMATYVDGKYTKTDTDKYDAVDYCMTYKLNDKDQECFLPDAADLWTQYMLRDFQQMAIDKIIETSSGVFTASNAYPVRTGAYYWASAEYSSTYAWYCSTSIANVGFSGSKWGSNYVRPSFAIDEA